MSGDIPSILEALEQESKRAYELGKQEGAREERERIWSHLQMIDDISLDHKDFARQVCNLIVKLKPEALKKKVEEGNNAR